MTRNMTERQQSYVCKNKHCMLIFWSLGVSLGEKNMAATCLNCKHLFVWNFLSFKEEMVPNTIK